MRWCFGGQRLPGLLKVSHVSPINKLRRSWLSYTNNCSVLICICCILQLHLEPNKIACRPGPSNLDVAMGPNFGYPQKVGSIRNVTSENLPSSIPKNSSDLRKSQQFHQLGAENSTTNRNLAIENDGKIMEIGNGTQTCQSMDSFQMGKLHRQFRYLWSWRYLP